MSLIESVEAKWFKACRVEDVPENGGVCVKFNSEQIAVFCFSRRNEWYASQNMCPHRQQMAIARGMLGSENGEPKVACPFHKKTFSLVDGRCLNSDDCGSLTTYPVRIENDFVYVDVSGIKDGHTESNQNCSYDKTAN
jgi:nitrite reductase (NADH) small subunit